MSRHFRLSYGDYMYCLSQVRLASFGTKIESLFYPNDALCLLGASFLYSFYLFTRRIESSEAQAVSNSARTGERWIVSVFRIWLLFVG